MREGFGKILPRMAGGIAADEVLRQADRRTIVIVLAVSLLISAIGAFWVAQKGGNHRDNNTVFADVFCRF